MSRSETAARHTGYSGSRRRERLTQSFAFQVLTAVFFCSIVPAAARWKWELLTDPSAGQITSLVATALAMIVSLVIMRRLASYPGVRSSTYVIPSLVTGFGIMLLTILLLRLEFTRYQVGAAMMISVVWSYILMRMARSQEKLFFDIVPFGNVDTLLQIAEAHTRKLRAPEL